MLAKVKGFRTKIKICETCGNQHFRKANAINCKTCSEKIAKEKKRKNLILWRKKNGRPERRKK